MKPPPTRSEPAALDAAVPPIEDVAGQDIISLSQTEPSLPAELFPLPLTAFEQLMLADDHPHYPRNFTVVLDFAGQLHQAAFEHAARALIRRNPLLSATVQKIGSTWHWIPTSFPDDHISWGIPDRDRECGPFTLKRLPGFRIHGFTDGTSSQVRLSFHHAVSDGRGARRVILDWITHYALAVTPDARITPADSLNYERLVRRGEIRRRPVRTPQPPVGVTRPSLWQRLRIIYEFVSQQPTPLRVARPRRHVQHRGCAPRELSCVFTAQDVSQFRDRIRGTPYNLTDVSVALLLNTIAKWNRAHGESGRDRLYRILVPVDLRDSGDELMPAANRLSFVFLTRPTSLCLDWPRLLSTIRAEMEYIDEHQCEYNLINALPIVQSIPGLIPFGMRLPACFSTAVLTSLGDTVRRFRPRFPEENNQLQIGNLQFIRARGAPPLRPKTRLAIGTLISMGEMVIDGQMDPHVYTQSDADEFGKLFVNNWRKWADGGPDFRNP
jgi:hypothetical protein